MYVFQNAHEKWWQKPLVRVNGQAMPAELAVLAAELRGDEKGMWINSRGTKTGVSSIKRRSGTIKTVRERFPSLIAEFLEEVYESTSLAKGCPDLVIWNKESYAFRFVEVKCPKWDRPSKEQSDFIVYANERGISATIVEWLFEEDANTT